MARTRITKADLESLVEIVKKATGDDGYYVEYAHGQPRLYRETDPDTGAAEEVSPRLPSRELSEWLEGFIEGALQPRANPHLPLDVVAMNPEDVPDEEELIEAARTVVFEIADFEAMTNKAAAAMRSLREAVRLYDEDNDDEE